MIFTLGDVLSVTTGRLMSRTGIDGVYRILSHMTGDNMYTHALPRAADECRPFLAEAFPALAGIEIPEFEDTDRLWDWLAAAEAEYGNEFDVEPIPAADHTVIDPIDEAAMLKRHGRGGNQ